MDQSVRIEPEVVEGASIVRLHGEFDLSVADELKQALVEQVAAHQVVVVDLSGVTFCDSSCLAAFVAGRRAADERGSVFRLAAAREIVSKVLRVAGLADYLQVHESVEAAIAVPA